MNDLSISAKNNLSYSKPFSLYGNDPMIGNNLGTRSYFYPDQTDFPHVNKAYFTVYDKPMVDFTVMSDAHTFFVDLPAPVTLASIVAAFNNLNKYYFFYDMESGGRIGCYTNPSITFLSFGFFNTADAAFNAVSATVQIAQPHNIIITLNKPAYYYMPLQTTNFSVKVNGVNRPLGAYTPVDNGVGGNKIRLILISPVAHGDVVTFSHTPVALDANYKVVSQVDNYPISLFCDYDMSQLPAIVNMAVTNTA